MRFSVAVSAAALVAGASAYSNGTTAYVTEVVSEYTTYCPAATEISHNGVTYTVSEATTLTITNCPCTITHSSSVVPVSASAVSTESSAAAVPTTAAPVVYSNGTSSATVVAPVGTASSGIVSGTATSSPISTFTGAANKAFAVSGAGLAAVFGLAAYVL